MYCFSFSLGHVAYHLSKHCAYDHTSLFMNSW